MKLLYLLIISGMLLIMPTQTVDAQEKLNLKEIFDKKLQKNIGENYSNIGVESTLTERLRLKDKTRTLYGIIFVVLELGLLVMLVKKWKDKTKSCNSLSKAELKNNIEKIRLEKIIHRNNEEMELLRKKLGEGKIKLDLTRNNLTRVAKELSVSKGEIYLAAKLKLMASK